MKRIFRKVVICEDHYVSFLGLEYLLRQRLGPNTQIANATGGLAALALFEKDKPDLILVDLGLPDISGLQLIKRIQQYPTPCQILVMTGSTEPHLLRQVTLQRVAGVLQKINTRHNLNEAISYLESGRNTETYLDSSVRALIDSKDSSALTRREYEVLNHMVTGLTSQQIAEQMKCSVTTVKTYRARIMNKSGARNSSEVMAWFLKGNINSDFRTDT